MAQPVGTSTMGRVLGVPASSSRSSGKGHKYHTVSQTQMQTAMRGPAACTAQVQAAATGHKAWGTAGRRAVGGGGLLRDGGRTVRRRKRGAVPDVGGGGGAGVHNVRVRTAVMDSDDDHGWIRASSNRQGMKRGRETPSCHYVQGLGAQSPY